MNFQASNLDAAYESLSSLNSLASGNGQNLVTGLKTLIGSLKNDWKGNDASAHINNLIDVYTGVATIVDNVHVVAHNASASIVQAQTVRQSNGGKGNVGTVFPTGTGSVEALDRLGSTTEFFVDPTAAPVDLQKLTGLKESFDSFGKEFSRLKEDLLGNWTSGSNREKAVSDFNQFEADSAKYRNYLAEAEANLTVAVHNLQQL